VALHVEHLSFLKHAKLYLKQKNIAANHGG
jgi:hypothetical protein